MSELETYGGSFDCQRFRDVSMYVLSAFSFALPKAVEILAEAFWRPGLSEEEVGVCIYQFHQNVRVPEACKGIATRLSRSSG